MNIAKLCRLVVLYTSVPLAVLGYVYLLSGYALTKPQLVEKLSLGFMTYRRAVEIHIAPTARLILVALALAHGFCGLWLASGGIANRVARLIVRTVIAALTLLAAVGIALLESLR